MSGNCPRFGPTLIVRTEARLWSLAGSGKRCTCGATFDWLGTATLTSVAEQAEEDQ